MYRLIDMFLDVTLRNIVLRQTGIVECMMLLPKYIKYKHIDRALRRANIQPSTLYHALASGFPTMTSTLFFACLCMEEIGEEQDGKV